MCIPVTTDPRKRTSHTFTSATGTASNPVRVDGGDCPPNSSFHVRAVDRRPCCDTALKLRASPDSRCRGSHPAGGGRGSWRPCLWGAHVCGAGTYPSGFRLGPPSHHEQQLPLECTDGRVPRRRLRTLGGAGAGGGADGQLPADGQDTPWSPGGTESPTHYTRARDTRGGRGLGLKTLCPAPPASCTPHPGRAGR